MKNAYLSPLLGAGLTENQAQIYEILLTRGPLRASKIHAQTELTRALVYKVLEELVELGLATKQAEPGQVAIFSATHPSALLALAQKKEADAKAAGESLQAALGRMVSDYNLISGRPGIRFFEGVAGLEKIYEDILTEGTEVCLIRSAYEPVYREQILPVVEKFIRQRVRRGITVQALTPKDAGHHHSLEEDAHILLKRTWLAAADYRAPVEIDIYGDKVALLSFGQELVGVILESAQIAQALRQVFLLAERGAQTAARKSG
ncbi:MAG: hypothetical protein HY978_04470 [Candidatus Liptonbacteria bacterium]|nr:hypothetical protein [Candidatus Liptonbacteria bacterium]